MAHLRLSPSSSYLWVILSLGQRTPASRYHPPKPRPVPLIPPAYPSRCLVRRVGNRGLIMLGGQTYFISKVFSGLPLGLLPQTEDSYKIFFGELLLGILHTRARRFICSDSRNQPGPRKGGG